MEDRGRAWPSGAGNRIRAEGKGFWVLDKDVILQAVGRERGTFPESKVKRTSKNENKEIHQMTLPFWFLVCLFVCF